MGSLDLKSQYSDILSKNGILDKIAEVEASGASDLAGEHMASLCEYVTVKFEDKRKKDRNFFVKKPVTISNAEHNELFANVMVKEGTFLTKFVNEMQKFCEEKLGTENDLLDKLFPKTFHADKDSIIMENVAMDGYFMNPKSLRQDFDLAKIVLSSLAQFHAISHILVQNEGSPDEFLKKHPTMYDMFLEPGCDIMISQMFDPTFTIILNMIKNSGKAESEAAIVKLEKYKGIIMNTIKSSLTGDALLHCVNHGDCWNNNMMFSSDRNRVMFVDLQINRINTPSIDLGYYIFTSTRQDVLSQWKKLLQIYYDEFKLISAKVGHPIKFTFEDLLKDFAAKSEFGFLFGLFMAVGIDALKGHDVENDGFEMNSFENMVTKFINEDTEKVKEIVDNIFNIIKIFEEVKSMHKY